MEITGINLIGTMSSSGAVTSSGLMMPSGALNGYVATTDPVGGLRWLPLVNTAPELSKSGYVGTSSLYFPSDGFTISRNDGTKWVQWGPIYKLTDPLLQTFAWLNQGSASVATSSGGIYLSIPDNTGGANWRIYKKSVANPPPWTIITSFISSTYPNGVSQGGLVLRQSSNGKFTTMATLGNGNVEIQKWNETSSFAALYLTFTSANQVYGRPIWWFKIIDDGVNRKYYISADGQNFRNLVVTTRTDFLTGDELGFGVNSDSVNKETGMLLLSWAEYTGSV